MLPDPRGFPPNGPQNWGSAFLPAEHQATMVRPSARNPIADLFPPKDSYVTRRSDADMQAALAKLNRRHEAERPGDSRLDARIRSYEMAARMQLERPEVLDLSKEPMHVLRMYGLDSLDIPLQTGISEKAEIQYFGRNCLVARRLLERGVRFVQVWSGADNGFPRRNWDSHEDIERDHWPLGRGLAVGAAALLKDLKQRGMLDDTIVLWTTEFGRMPCSQGSKGRDHNPFVFTNWLAGGGIKGGVTSRRQRRMVVQAGRPEEADLRLRYPRHHPAPAGHRSRKADRPSQRHRPPFDRRTWASGPGNHGLNSREGENIL